MFRKRVFFNDGLRKREKEREHTMIDREEEEGSCWKRKRLSIEKVERYSK